MGKFVVAMWKGTTKARQGSVEAPTAEHAIAKVATRHRAWRPGTVLEAWPMDQPRQIVKFTF